MHLNKEFQEKTTGLFKVRTANQCVKEAAEKPTPENLYQNMVYEGELTVLFADTGVGKSIYAVQMGDEISKKRKVLYPDLELSDKQFQTRYTNCEGKLHCFNDNFLRACFSDNPDIPKGYKYDDYIIDSLEDIIREEGIDVLILDNMSMLCQGDTDKARVAKPLMSKLIALKMKYNLTLVIVDHTKKRLDYAPISENDLQGSKMKANLVDSMIFIGRSRQGEKIRYIQHVKSRTFEAIYHKNNVMVCEVQKDDAFLSLKQIGTSKEGDHLKVFSDNEDRDKEILALKQQGLSNIAIAECFQMSEANVRKILIKCDSENCK